MAFVNFIATLLLIYLALRVAWMLFGRRLAILAIKRFARRLEDEMLRQNQPNAHPNSQAGAEEVFINRNLKVRYPKPSPKPKKPENLSSIAEDVEFEDVN